MSRRSPTPLVPLSLTTQVPDQRIFTGGTLIPLAGTRPVFYSRYLNVHPLIMGETPVTDEMLRGRWDQFVGHYDPGCTGCTTRDPSVICDPPEVSWRGGYWGSQNFPVVKM